MRSLGAQIDTFLGLEGDFESMAFMFSSASIIYSTYLHANSFHSSVTQRITGNHTER